MNENEVIKETANVWFTDCDLDEFEPYAQWDDDYMVEVEAYLAELQSEAEKSDKND